MKRFLVFALFGALSVAGGTGMAFGQHARSQAHSTPQATKPRPPAPPAKRQPSKSLSQVKKSPSQAHQPPAKRSKSPSQAHKGQAKPGKGPQRGEGSYSWDDYMRDLSKANQEERDGVWEQLPGELQVAGAAIAGSTAGPPGVVGGALGAVGKNLPQLVEGKEKELKGDWDGISATGKFIGARLNDISKSNPRPTNPRFGMGR
jgi:hypothetical protein